MVHSQKIENKQIHFNPPPFFSPSRRASRLTEVARLGAIGTLQAEALGAVKALRTRVAPGVVHAGATALAAGGSGMTTLGMNWDGHSFGLPQYTRKKRVSSA